MDCPSCHTSVDASQRFCPACGTALSPADEQQEKSIVGQVLGGKYKVVRLIGEGGMGAVFEGEQQLGTTKRKVAVKTLHPHLSRDPKIKARFEREVGTVAELEHPNTIQVFDFGANEDGILYIVMEFLQGRSLATVLEKEGPMPPDRALRILQQVCGSLEEAHGRGIVHRDLKPDNVVLVERAGKKDFVKVLDFGIAKRSHEVDSAEQKLTQQGMVLGTPPYMSPEQFTGRPIDARSDIYSLGIMAYEMLTGRLPFQANTAWEWATQHMTQSPIPIESLAGGLHAPEPMRRAIRQALAKSADERFQTVAEFISAFSGQPPEAGAAVRTEAAMAARQKTELGAPLDVAAAFAGQSGAGEGPDARRGGAPTPAGANVSFPTPAAIPQAPPRAGKGGHAGAAGGEGRGRGLLLGVAGLVGVISIGAIVFAVRGSSHGSKPVEFDPAMQVTPATSLTAGSAAPSDSGGATGEKNLTTSSDVPPLTGGAAGGGGAVHGGPSRPLPVHSASPGPSGAAPPPPGPAVGPPPGPQPLPPHPRYDGPECVTARKLRALGHPREAEQWALACIAKGGTP